MKKLLPLLVFTICLGSAIEAQEFFFKISGGYGWPGLQNTGSILGPSINLSQPNVDALTPMANITDIVHSSFEGPLTNQADTINKSYKPIHGSYGQGGAISFRFGYMVNPYFGVDLGVAYLHGANITCSQTYDLAGADGPLVGQVTTPTYLNATITTHSYGLSALPSITVAGAKPGFKVYPYARVGLTLPVWGKVIHDVNINVTPFPTGFVGTVLKEEFLGANVNAELQTQATVSLGVNASIGVAYKPLPWLDAFLEVAGQYLNVKASSTTITKWTADGTNDIPARGVYRTQFTYVDELTQQSNNAQYNSNYNPNQPKQDIRPIAPFSNLGINAGLTFYLSKKILGKNKDKNK